MERTVISSTGSRRLILIFLGWGMDATPFLNLRKEGYDILSLCNYTRFSAREALAELLPALSEYREIVVVAWSFGVRVAQEFLLEAKGRLPITRTVAVNGTPLHIHNSCGIPEANFRGTLANLSEVTVRKFNRRMFASAANFQAYTAAPSQRSLTSLAAELEWFGSLAPVAPAPVWDRAVVGSADLIFPAANQAEGWSGTPTDTIDGMPHFPPMQELLHRYIINKRLVAERFTEAAPTYAANAPVQQQVAERLWALTAPRLAAQATSPLSRPSPAVLEIGVGNGTLTRLYAPSLPADTRLTLWDIAPIAPALLPAGATFECCDAEIAIAALPAASVSVLLSSSTMQWFHSPRRFLEQVYRVLTPGGVAALSFYGPGTFSEISELTGQSLRYPDVASLAAELQPFERLCNSAETATQHFADVREMLRHMQLTGVNALTGGSESHGSALRLMRRFPTAPDGSATLTYHPVYLLLRKP